MAGALAESASATHTSENAATFEATSPHVSRETAWPEIPRYRILKRIGIGGMGEVYAAEQQQPRRTVALKVVRSGLSTHRNLQRFAYEAEALARLHHPGIAQVYESGTAQSGAGVVPFFAMELVRGPAGQAAAMLTQYAQANNLGTRQRLELLARVADAVHHAHQNGVIHRDLKPSNVLVDESGQPKVLDFGVARVTDGDIQAVTLQTDIGQIVGTLPYMSPEQAGGDPSQIDTRTDVYGLGALAYELLVGRPPLDLKRSALHEAVRVIREEEPKTLSSIERSLRGDVETIVAKALAKEKKRRYESAAEFAADIRRYLNHEPISARPNSAIYQFAKFTRRNKTLVGGTVAVILALVAGTITTTWQAARAKDRAQAAINAETAANKAKGEAIAAEAETRVQLKKISELAARFIDLEGKLSGIPGTTAASKALVSTALPYLDAVAQALPDDFEVQYQLMISYNRVGEVGAALEQGTNSATGGSIESHKKAMAIADRLLTIKPDDLQIQVWRAAFHGSIAMEYHRMHDNVQALKFLKEGIDYVESLRRKHPDDLRVLKNLRTLLVDTGVVVGNAGDHAKGLESLRRAKDLSVEIYGREKTLDNLENVGTNLRQMAHLEVQLDNYQAGLNDCLEGLRLLESAPDGLANRRLARLKLALRDKAADAQIYLRQSLEAYDQYPPNLKLAETLAKDPEDLTARRDLVQCYLRFAKICLNLIELDQAIAAIKKAREIELELIKNDPRDVSGRYQLAYCYWLLGTAHLGGAPFGNDGAASVRQAREAFLEGQKLAQQYHFGDILSPARFAAAITQTYLAEAIMNRRQEAGWRSRLSATAPPEAFSKSSDLLRLRIEKADGNVDFYQLSNDFWEDRLNGVVHHRYRVVADVENDRHKGIVLMTLPDGLAGAELYNCFIPMPPNGATAEFRPASADEWQALGTIRVNPQGAAATTATTPRIVPEAAAAIDVLAGDVERKRKTLEADDPQLLAALNAYGRALYKAGKPGEAEQPLMEAARGAEASADLGPEHAQTQAYARDWADCLVALKQADSAADIRKRFKIK